MSIYLINLQSEVDLNRMQADSPVLVISDGTRENSERRNYKESPYSTRVYLPVVCLLKTLN